MTVRRRKDSRRTTWLLVGAGAAMVAGQLVERGLDSGWRAWKGEDPPTFEGGDSWSRALAWTALSAAAGSLSDRIDRLHELRRLKDEGQLDLLPAKERISMLNELEKLEEDSRAMIAALAPAFAEGQTDLAVGVAGLDPLDDHSGRPFLDHEGLDRGAAPRAVERGPDHDRVGPGTGRDIDLLAVDDVVVSVEHRGRLHRCGVRAEGRLGDGHRCPGPVEAGELIVGYLKQIGIKVDLLPATDAEAEASKRIVDTAREQGGPIVESAKSAGQHIASQMQDSAGEAAQQVAETAKSSARTVKEEGSASADRVKS